MKIEHNGKTYETVRIDRPERGDLYLSLTQKDGPNVFAAKCDFETVHALIVREIPPAVPPLPPIPDGWRLLKDNEVMDGTEMRCDGVDEDRMKWDRCTATARGMTIEAYKKKWPSLYILAVIRKTYAKIQAEWVEQVGLKVGDKVKVLREPTIKEKIAWINESTSGWVEHMNRYVGEVLEVVFIEDDSVNSQGYAFPCFVLEKVVVKTRPMNREEFLKAWKERGWCPLAGVHSGCLYCVSCVKEGSIGLNGGHWVGFGDSRGNTLLDYCFASDNSPCTMESYE